VVCRCPPSSHLVKKTQEPLQPRDHRWSCCCHSWLVTLLWLIVMALFSLSPQVTSCQKNAGATAAS
jgi:hypothetical protein